MLNNYLKPLIGLFILSVLFLAIAAGLFMSVLEPYYLTIFPYLLIFFFIVNAGALYLKFSAFSGRPQSFPRKFMVINGLRIFAYIIFIGAYLFFNIENSTVFLLGFLTCYFVYFIFDMSISNRFR